MLQTVLSGRSKEGTEIYGIYGNQVKQGISYAASFNNKSVDMGTEELIVVVSYLVLLVARLESPLWLIDGFCQKFWRCGGDLRRPFAAV